jgi:hypothetical protein
VCDDEVEKERLDGDGNEVNKLSERGNFRGTSRDFEKAATEIKVKAT